MKIKRYLEKNKTNILEFVIILAITLIIFIPFLIGHYATDTYNIANIGYKNYAINWSLNDGRIFMTIIGLIADKINISIEAYVFVTLISALIISCISVCVLKKITEKYKKPKNILQNIILVIISYVTIFNFMYLEDMYFVESVVMATSVLLYLLTADILVTKNKNYIIKSLLLTILGILCYQGTIGILFAFVILFTILKNKNDIKRIIIDLIKSGVTALVAVLLNIGTVKIVGNLMGMKQTRLGDLSNIFKNIRTIFLTLPNILQETCNLFPRNALLLFLGLLTVIVILYVMVNKKYKEHIVIKYFSIALITILGSCVTYILTLTSFYTGRLRNALGAVVGILFLFIFSETNVFEKIQKNNKKFILGMLTITILISYMIIVVINSESIMLQHKRVNKLEKIEVNKIEQYIEEYENNTGIKVTKIAKIVDTGNLDKSYFEGTKNKTSFTHNAIRTSWAADGVINFYTKRRLQTTKDFSKQEYKELKNTESGYLCIDDILYVMVYMY